MYGTIYKITCLKNGKVYVGQTTRPLQVRWNAHVQDAKKGKQTHFYNAIRKYKKDAFTIEAIDYAFNQQQLDALEEKWIARLDSFENGYNGTTGGEHPTHSAETKLKTQATRNRNMRYKIFMLFNCGYDVEDIPQFFQRRPQISETHKLTDKYKNSQKLLVETIAYCEPIAKNGRGFYKKKILDWEMEEEISGLSH